MTTSTPYPIDRTVLGDWLNKRGLVGEMAEIGCAFGGFARIVLAQWAGAKYHMVDPWTAQDTRVYREAQEQAWKYNTWFEECSALAEEDKRVSVIRNFSHLASPLFKEGQLDCCYIDGNHSFEAVTTDLECWWPKVKSGGLFCGHDFYNSTVGGNWCYVEDAVIKWMAGKNLVLERAPCSSWWILKP